MPALVPGIHFLLAAPGFFASHLLDRPGAALVLLQRVEQCSFFDYLLHKCYSNRGIDMLFAC
jgi:hypothetical protein